MEVIYSKFSNDRSPLYSIRTDILKDKNGNKYIEKIPSGEEAKAHVASVFAYEEKLKEIYKDTPYVPNAVKEIEGRKVFEFVKGESMETELDALIDKGKVEEAFDKLVSYMEIMLKAHEKEDFVLTDEFKKVFGDVPEDLPLFKESKSAPVTNVDIVPANIIGNTVIDYEWTFDFPIPAKFVIYRIIYYYMEGAKRRHVLRDFNLYGKMGITASELLIFQEMELSLQDHIAGDVVPVWQLREILAKTQKSFIDGEILNKGKTYEELETDLRNVLAAKENAEAALKETSEKATEMAATLDSIYRNPLYKLTKPFRMLKGSSGKEK